MHDCWAANSEDRPDSFDVVVSRLEIIKKQLQDWRTANHLTRISAKKKSETEVKRPSSEPENVLTSGQSNKELPPKPPAAKSPYVDDIPQSPFDRHSVEETPDEDTHPQGNMGNELPVSPFN